MNEKKSKNVERQRVIALLNRGEIEFLDKLGLDALFSTGLKLSRVEIVAALVDAAMALEISAKDVKDKEELVRRILAAARMQKERREFPRLRKNLMVGFKKMDSMEECKAAVTDDVGMGGFRIDVASLETPASVNDIVELAIKDPRDNAGPIKAIGRIVWVRGEKDNNGYEVGIMLTYVARKDIDRFMQYLSAEVDTEGPEE